MCTTPFRKATAVPLAWVPLEAALVRKRHELRARLANRERLEVQGESDPIDLCRAISERDDAAIEKNRESGLLAQVEAALERMASGEYGRCACGDEISPARLAAVPWCLRCIGCEEEFEMAMADEAEDHDGQ